MVDRRAAPRSRAAVLFVFPSYLETFGHPLLEAMAAGVPLVASGIDSFREVAGDAALFFPYDDVDALANAIEYALGPETAAELVRQGNARDPTSKGIPSM